MLSDEGQDNEKRKISKQEILLHDGKMKKKEGKITKKKTAGENVIKHKMFTR